MMNRISKTLARFFWCPVECRSVLPFPMIFSFALELSLCAGENQTGVDREWIESVNRAKAEGRPSVAQLLTGPAFKTTTWTLVEGTDTNLTYRGRPLIDFLFNKQPSRTNHATLDEMFSLRKVMTGKEPEIVTYQLPINYYALTNMTPPDLDILLDSAPGDEIPHVPALRDFRRATNGDTLLVWNTTQERAGQHVLQAYLEYVDYGRQIELRGPVEPYYSTNLFRFVDTAQLFGDSGALFRAELTTASNAVFNIEIKTPAGGHLKNLAGATSNGTIDATWDLEDDQGRYFVGRSFDAYFRIELLKSNISQVLIRKFTKVPSR